jgi:hypothetical protein
VRLTSLTVVLPGLDTEHLRGAVRDATRAAARCADRHEIVIVDDGRADDTIALAGALAARDPCVRLVVHASDREAERTGVAAAHMEWVVIAHAGFDFDELADFAVRSDQSARVRGPRAALRRLRDTVARA